MIINRDESEITVLGDVQKFKVSIDERNINHIVTILSSNLYSHPMQSFLRETVSNAVDSHIEAGVEEPIIITITDQDISIRDYGTGISPERFQEIYINIGSSTKRESNEFIGSFGLGRFSALSVSSLVNVTSFYNGKASYYVMNKDIDQLHVDILYEKDTDEPNGVEVKIPYDKSEELKAEDWRCLGFINNVYIQDDRSFSSNGYRCDRDLADAFNKRKVLAYNTFKHLNIGYPFSSSKNFVLVGDIPYEVDMSSFMDSTFRYDWKSTFTYVYPQVKIGEVDVTPNREGLLYSDRTKRVLEKAYLDAAAELSRMFTDQCEEEKSNFSEYLDAVTSGRDNYIKIDDVLIPVSDKLPRRIKFHGFENLDQIKVASIMRTLKYTGEQFMVAELNDNVMTKKFKSYRYDFKYILHCLHSNSYVCYAVDSAVGMSGQYFKGYIQEKHPDSTVMFLRKPVISKSNVKSFIINKYGISTLTNSEEVHIIIKTLKELLMEMDAHVLYEDFMASPEYKAYKEAHKVKKTYTTRDNTKLSVHVFSAGSIDTTYTDTVTNIIEDLKSDCKRDGRSPRMVYAELDSPFISAVRELLFPNLLILGLSKANYKAVQNGLFPDWIKPIETLYSGKERHLRRIATIKRYVNTSLVCTLPPYFPEPLREKSRKLKNILNNLPYVPDSGNSMSFVNLVDEEDEDLEIMALWNDVKDALKFEHEHPSLSRFELYILMKNKKLRLSQAAYFELRNYINRVLYEDNKM